MTHRQILMLVQAMTALLGVGCFCAALLFTVLGERDHAIAMLLSAMGMGVVYTLRKSVHRSNRYN